MEIISPFSPDSLNLEKIKQTIKDDLIANNVITDINYEGSNISILTQILAYLTYTINATHALNANQTSLMLSQIRQNIIHEAQTRGYNITRKISSKMNITISINPLNPVLTIPKWTQFICGEYIFYNTENLSFTAENLSYTIDLIEGSFIDYTTDENLRYTATKSQEFVNVNYTDIENNNVFLRVKKAGTTECTEYYTKVFSLVDIVNNKTNYFEEYDPETQFLNLWVSFANQGNLINIGDMVDIAFLISSGSVANGLIDCALGIFNEDITITVNSASRGGQDEETNDSIRINAPQFYNTGKRTVSAADYNAYLIKNSLVKDAWSWGGETILPMKLGHVFMSLVPQDTNFKYLSSLEEAEIIRYLNEKHMIATGRIFKHPNYIQLDFDIKFLGTVINPDGKKTEIINVLNSYFNEFHNTFGTYIFQNKLIRLIESVFEDVPGASVTIDIKPRLRISKELFQQTFDNGRYDIWIPNSSKKYYLTKGSDRIEYPEDEKDLYSYYLNGWTKNLEYEEDILVSFTGTINSKSISYSAFVTTVTIGDTVYNKRDLLLDGSVIGYFIMDLNILSLTNLTTEVTTTDGFIDLTFLPEINVKAEKSTLIELGNIHFL